jgi:hypothetical protein
LPWPCENRSSLKWRSYLMGQLQASDLMPRCKLP